MVYVFRFGSLSNYVCALLDVHVVSCLFRVFVVVIVVVGCACCVDGLCCFVFVCFRFISVAFVVCYCVCEFVFVVAFCVTFCLCGLNMCLLLFGLPNV